MDGLDPSRPALATGVFDDHAHALLTILVRQVAKHPDARMVHFDDRRGALRGAKPKHRYGGRRRYRVAVEPHNLERMARQGQTAILGSAPVEDMKQHAFGALYVDRLTMAQPAAVDGKYTVADLVTLRRHASFLLGFV